MQPEKPPGGDLAAFLNAHPDAKRAFETFYSTGQGWEDTASLISLLLSPECAEERCGHRA